MKKRTLHFHSLRDLVSFSQPISKGYLINTINNTITSEFTIDEIERAMDEFGAGLMHTSNRVYSYMPDNEDLQ
jgi:tRNA U38,U39,U40 pseudouridine synthase TruA